MRLITRGSSNDLPSIETSTMNSPTMTRKPTEVNIKNAEPVRRSASGGRLKTIVLITTALFALAGCAEKKQKAADEAVPVSVAKAEQKNVPIEVHAIGSVQ